MENVNVDLTQISDETNKTSLENEEKVKELNRTKTEAKRKRVEIETEAKLKAILKESFETPWFKAMVKCFYSPHFLLKLFLFLFIIASTVYASYLTIQSIMDYLDFGVTTTTRSYYETPMLFPRATFCNLNAYTTEYAYDLLTQNTYQGGSQQNDYSFLNMSDEEKKKLVHDIYLTLLECTFNNEPCFLTDFTWSFDHSYGNCFTFNTGFDSNGSSTELKKSSITGSKFGLRLILYVNYYEKLLELIRYLGALVRFGNSSYLSDSSNYGSIRLSPGTSTYISIAREFKSLQPMPYSNCELDSNSPKLIPGQDLYNLITKMSYLYTQQFCFIQCYQKYNRDTFDFTCLDFFSLFNASSFRYCGNINETFINKHCLSACPLECDQISYKTSLSFGQLSGDGFSRNSFPQLHNPTIESDFINRTLNSQTVKESIVEVSIFYESLSYTLSTEYFQYESPQMDGVFLMGSIGGNLGLFLGISVFSISKIIEVTIEIILIFSKKNNVQTVDDA